MAKQITYKVIAGCEQIAVGGKMLIACTQAELKKLFMKGQSHRIEEVAKKVKPPPPTPEENTNDNE